MAHVRSKHANPDRLRGSSWTWLSCWENVGFRLPLAVVCLIVSSMYGRSKDFAGQQLADLTDSVISGQAGGIIAEMPRLAVWPSLVAWKGSSLNGRMTVG